MKKRLCILLTLALLLFSVWNIFGATPTDEQNAHVSLTNIPAYSGSLYVQINDGTPFFTTEEMTTKSFERFSPLDSLGRCGVAMANVGRDIMPTQDRESISHVKPSGWHSLPFDNVNGRYLYNRSHLIAFQLTGENDTEENLITGTTYFNQIGMVPFENMIADYVKETNNHVLYRVTPMYQGENLVANGVLMEAKSVEDDGAGICFNVYMYNVQPDISIDYSTGMAVYQKDGHAVKEMKVSSNQQAGTLLDKLPTAKEIERLMTQEGIMELIQKGDPQSLLIAAIAFLLALLTAKFGMKKGKKKRKH